MKTVIAACLAGLFTSAAWATTWAPTKADDPLNDGRSDDAATYHTVERRFDHFQMIAELRDLEPALKRRVLSAQAHYDERIVGDSAGSVDAPCQAIPITQPLIAADEDSLETVLLMAVLGDYTHEVGNDAGGEDERAGLE